MPESVLLFLFLGFAIGSFLNVVVLRLEADKLVNGRSHCPSCGTLIHWYDNIPVLSFFLLGRRCRRCHFPISWQYPTVELGTGLLFALFGSLAIGSGSLEDITRVVYYLFLVALLITIAVYDARNMEIPLVLLLSGVGGTLAFVAVTGFLQGIVTFSLYDPVMLLIAGGVISASLFYALVFYSKETWMGMGDVWLAGIAGAAVGLPALLLLFTLSFFFGAIVGGVLLFLKKKGMGSQVPFAPFLALGTLSTLLLQAFNPWWLSLFLLPLV